FPQRRAAVAAGVVDRVEAPVAVKQRQRLAADLHLLPAAGRDVVDRGDLRKGHAFSFPSSRLLASSAYCMPARVISPAAARPFLNPELELHEGCAPGGRDS